MSDATTIAASGLRAAEQAFTAAAFNIVSAANQAPQAAPPAVSAQIVPASPGLDLATQMVAQFEAASEFRANLAVYRTASEMYRALLKAI